MNHQISAISTENSAQKTASAIFAKRPARSISSSTRRFIGSFPAVASLSGQGGRGHSAVSPTGSLCAPINTALALSSRWRGNLTRAGGALARVFFISSGVCDLRPIRAALAVVAKVVRPLSLARPLQEASESDYGLFYGPADVDSAFISFRVVAHETNHEGNTWKTHSQNVATYREHRAEKFSDYRTEKFGDRL